MSDTIKTKRQEALEVYKQHRPPNVTHPDEQGANIPQFDQGFKLFVEWQRLADAATKNDPLGHRLVDLEKTMFFVDAGFHHPDYLEEVLGWLRADRDDAFRASHPEAVHQIELKIDQIRELLPENRRKLYF